MRLRAMAVLLMELLGPRWSRALATMWAAMTLTARKAREKKYTCSGHASSHTDLAASHSGPASGQLSGSAAASTGSTSAQALSLPVPVSGEDSDSPSGDAEDIVEAERIACSAVGSNSGVTSVSGSETDSASGEDDASVSGSEDGSN